MPASLNHNNLVDSDLLKKEAALIEKMSGLEKTVQDLAAQDGWSDEDDKKYKELNKEIDSAKKQVQAVQSTLQNQVDNRDKALVASESSKSGRDGRPSMQKQMVNFIKHGSRKKLDEGDQEFLHEHDDVGNLYNNIQENGGGVSMLRIPISKDAFDGALARIQGGPRATITTDGVSSENEAGVEVPPGGGYSDYSTTVQQTLDTNLIYNLMAWGGMMKAIKVVSTEKGGPYIFNRLDPGDAQGEWLTESYDDTSGSEHLESAQRKGATVGPVPSTKTVELKAHILSSKIVSVSMAAQQDSDIDLEMTAIKQMNRRMGRSIAIAITSGDTEALNAVETRVKPVGFKEFAGNGGTSATSAKINWEDLYKMVDTINQAYLDNSETTDPRSGDFTSMGDRASFMLDRSVETAILMEKDSDNRPLWLPNLATQGFNLIRGYPYFKNHQLDSLAASSKSAAFGLWNHYAFRVVREIVLFRMTDSVYATKYSVGLLQFGRFDGYHIGPVDASGKAEAYKIMTTKA